MLITFLLSGDQANNVKILRKKIVLNQLRLGQYSSHSDIKIRKGPNIEAICVGLHFLQDGNCRQTLAQHNVCCLAILRHSSLKQVRLPLAIVAFCVTLALRALLQEEDPL